MSALVFAASVAWCSWSRSARCASSAARPGRRGARPAIGGGRENDRIPVLAPGRRCGPRCRRGPRPRRRTSRAPESAPGLADRTECAMKLFPKRKPGAAGAAAHPQPGGGHPWAIPNPQTGLLVCNASGVMWVQGNGALRRCGLCPWGIWARRQDGSGAGAA